MRPLHSQRESRLRLAPLDELSSLGESRRTELTPDGILQTESIQHVAWLECGHPLSSIDQLGGICSECERRCCRRSVCFRICMSCGAGYCGRHYHTGEYEERWICRACARRAWRWQALAMAGRVLLIVVSLPLTLLCFLAGDE